MSKMLFTGALACTVALAAAPSIQAGERIRKQVSIDEVNGFFRASGHAGDVFNSQGKLESIWCRLMGVDDYNSAHCFARDEGGKTLQCVTENDAVIRAISTISGDSAIQFLIPIKGGRCANVTVTNGSFAAPKRQTTPEEAAETPDMTGSFDEVK